MNSRISIARFGSVVAVIVGLFGDRLAAAETEPNNSRAQANVLTFTNGVASNTGKINPLSDVDYFRIVTPAFGGQATMTIVMTPTAPDNDLDAAFQLQDTNGVVLVDRDAGSDDAPETVIYTQATGGTTYFIACRSEDFFIQGAGDYSLQITLNDPDDQISEATAFGAATETSFATSQIESATDVDMFSISVQAGQRISFDIDQASGGFDSYVRLFNSAGTQLAVSDDAPGPGETNSLSSYLEYTFTNSGTFYLGVSGYANSNYNAVAGTGDVNGSTGSYTLILSPGLTGLVRRPGDTTDYLVDIVRLGTNPAAIDPNQRTWIVIHGWNSSRAEPNISQLASSLFETQPGDQVLTLDWSSAAASALPFDAENSIVPVAQWAAAALTNAGFNGTNLNLMGHSFGSYVADEIAQRIPGGVNTIVTLDPAANVFGGYDSEASVDFGRDSLFSWSFHASSLGNEYTPATADEAFIVDSGNDPIAAHSDVVFLFAYLLMLPSDPVGQFFLLTRLLSYALGPWVPDQFISDFSGDDPVQGYEAIITTTPNGTNAQSITFVTNAPALSITSHSDATNVMVNPIVLTGTATDAGRGGSGISSVLVNGVLANNGTASGTAIANWNRQLSLTFGTNLITVIARDGSVNQAATTNVITIHLVALPSVSIGASSGLAQISWHVAYSAFTLEQATNLVSGGWTTISNAPVVIGESNVVVLTNSQPRQFFRLKR